MTNIVRLRDWAVVTPNGSPYVAPEYLPRYLRGRAENHPAFEPDTIVTTSRIQDSTGRIVQTASRAYELVGPPESGYFAYLVEAGLRYDEANPIKVLQAG